MDTSALPYRPGVGIVLRGGDGRVFAARRIDTPAEAWQMPQGGVDAGERPEETALRELEEETGIPPALVRILRATPEPLRYDLPPELVPSVWGGRYRGQEQTWFLMDFLGEDSDINIETAHPEFSEWRWMEPPELIRRIVPFKRDLYRRIFETFADAF